MDTLTQYAKLQNGSDVRGVALEGVEGEHVNLTPEIAGFIASAFAEFTAEKTGKALSELTVSVGHDSRISADALQAGVLSGLRKMGCRALECGLASTPAMFMSTVLSETQCDGAVMITASHLPFNRNGLKFFTRTGGLESSDIKGLLKRAAALSEEKPGAAAAEGPVEPCALLDHYSACLRGIISRETGIPEAEKPLSGLHIVVDAGNGAGGFFAGKVLEPLGADVSGSVFLEPDGTFPNHIPNPENAKAMESIQQATLSNHADLGVIFDTDVDRAAIVFSNGKEINKNGLIALMAAILAPQNPGSTIVTDSVTSEQLAEFLTGLGLKHHRFKRGYRNVINESIRLNAEGVPSCLAIETSGHGALKENYFLDDGAYMSVKVICELVRCRRAGKPLEGLIASLKEPAEARELRPALRTEDFKAYGNGILEGFRAFAEKDGRMTIVEPNFEGIRVSFKQPDIRGWMLLRLSLHDPILPINLEANVPGGTDRILEIVKPFFAGYDRLDNSVFG